MRSYQIEKVWMTEANMLAVALVVEVRKVPHHRCGYVFVSANHPTHGMDYREVDVSVHGGLTYKGQNCNYPVPTEKEGTWFGFDCNHENDCPIVPFDTEDYKLGLPIRSLEYVVEQCELLARQLNED